MPTRVLGVTGGFHRVEDASGELPNGWAHDGAAVLLEDGEVVAAIEEERLNRIKHSNKAALRAVRFCLDERKISLSDVDYIGYYVEQSHGDAMLRRLLVQSPIPGVKSMMDAARFLFGMEFGDDVGERLRFVGHHQCHALSATLMSGFPTSLAITLDGRGETDSGTIAVAEGGDLRTLRRIPAEGKSLGWFYDEVIAYLGYAMFDEYKVMGLAPYGDASKYRTLFDTFYELLPDGDWKINFDKILSLWDVMLPRERGTPFEQIHKDIAASLQEALEKITFHMLEHFRRETGLTSLCYSGGVAHNSTMNGKILRSGLFDRVFIQPAAHDAGCAIGAALAVHQLEKGPLPTKPLQHVYWGTDTRNDAAQKALETWQAFVEYEKSSDVTAAAAKLIADGNVIGWMQGRSEFGPRALGNRSILADPRPAENKKIVNAMVKKREAYRPFAPSVLEERASEFFEIPKGVPLPFMVFVVDVVPDKRELLGAITHVDGSARVQTVSRAQNERYWSLINEFGKLTGVPMVLNTSFNNNAEPIVDSEEDSIVCFLTTGLNALVIGDYVVRKKPSNDEMMKSLFLKVEPFAVIRAATASVGGTLTTRHYVGLNFSSKSVAEITPAAHAALVRADGTKTVADLFREAGVSQVGEKEIAIVRELWSQRVIRLSPRSF